MTDQTDQTDARPETAADTIARLMTEAQITVSSEYVPWSRSPRNPAPGKPGPLGQRQLTWNITITVAGRAVLSTIYSAGIGHAPAYKTAPAGSQRLGRFNSDQAEAIEFETETGRVARRSPGSGRILPGQPIEPDRISVISSLMSDSDVLQSPSFESWAQDLGYDTDSRKAEEIYRACLATALALKNAMPPATFDALAEAGREY